jgi:hypothetical protein
MLIALYKAFTLLFPFLHELFIANKKDKNKRERNKKPVEDKYKWLKYIVIVIGIVSFLGFIVMGKVYFALREEIRHEREKYAKPIPKVVVQQPVPPAPPPILTPVTPYIPDGGEKPVQKGKSRKPPLFRKEPEPVAEDDWVVNRLKQIEDTNR